MAGTFFSFPNPVNDVAARTVALGVVTMSAVALGFGLPWMTIPLAYGFVARVLTGLMDLRGIPVKAMAMETRRSMSTIHMLRNGRLNPKPLLIQEIAKSLEMSEADLRIIAGIDDGSSGS